MPLISPPPTKSLAMNYDKKLLTSRRDLISPKSDRLSEIEDKV